MRDKFFEVDVACQDPEGDIAHLGTWKGLADNESHARSLAIEDQWQPRLTTAGCSPVAIVMKLQRYLVCESWEHLVARQRRALFRWALDQATLSLVRAEVATGGVGSEHWRVARPEDRDDLMASLLKHGVAKLPELGITVTDCLPSWCTVAVIPVAENAHPEL